MTAIAIIWFEVSLRGSFAGLLLGSLLFLLSTLGIGLPISSYSRTQQQAMLLAFLITMLIRTLSGFAFPINNMPEAIQWLSWLDPAVLLPGADPGFVSERQRAGETPV